MFLAVWRKYTGQEYSIIRSTIHLYVADLTVLGQLNEQ